LKYRLSVLIANCEESLAERCRQLSLVDRSRYRVTGGYDTKQRNEMPVGGVSATFVPVRVKKSGELSAERFGFPPNIIRE
jgi:hypothetical protein